MLRADPSLDACVTHLQNFWIDELADEAERLRDHPLAQPQPGYVTVTLMARHDVFDRVGRLQHGTHGGRPDGVVRACHRRRRAHRAAAPTTLVYRRMHRHNLSWHSGESRQMTDAMKAAILRVVKDTLDRRRKRKD
jgi:hypothetical protein